MRVTAQRWAVYEALLSAYDHPGPEALFRRLRRRWPSLSLATVYKTLDALVELGLVREVSVAGDRKRFDANQDRHHHLVCTKCRSVSDLYDSRLDGAVPAGEVEGFRVREVSVQVIGVCARCARRYGLETETNGE